jgi:hypothetical protein
MNNDTKMSGDNGLAAGPLAIVPPPEPRLSAMMPRLARLLPALLLPAAGSASCPPALSKGGRRPAPCSSRRPPVHRRHRRRIFISGDGLWGRGVRRPGGDGGGGHRRAAGLPLQVHGSVSLFLLLGGAVLIWRTCMLHTALFCLTSQRVTV